MLHPTLNPPWPSEEFPRAADASVVWWRCPEDHEFQASIRTVASSENPCLVCSGRLVRPGVNDLATTHPELAERWVANLNPGLTSSDVTAASEIEIVLTLSCSHAAPATPAAWVLGDIACPLCG